MLNKTPLSNQTIGIRYDKIFKTFIYTALLVAFTSCRSYRTAEGKVSPVYFTASPKIFSDSIFPPLPLWYNALQGLRGNVIEHVELRDGEVGKSFIKSPTIFRNNSNVLLVYPGDTVRINEEYNKGVYSFSIPNGNLTRNREAAFLQTFQKLEKRVPVVPEGNHYTLQTLIDVEEEFKDALQNAEKASQAIFDSLIKVHDVSPKFLKLTNEYVHNKYDVYSLLFYKTFKDTLLANGLYRDKLQQLLPAINSITKKEKFNSNIKYMVNDLVEELFPKNMMWSFNDEGFKACFDSVQNNFDNRAKDYLLSRIMYRAYAKGLSVPSEYRHQYMRHCTDKEYKKIVFSTKKEHRRNESDKKGGKNILLAADGKSELTFEKMMAKHKGKFVLIDMWASWCGPCLKEMPHMNKLREKYAENEIVFLPISIDKQTWSWRKTMQMSDMPTTNSYLLLNAYGTSFYKKYKINGIPRYLLFGKDGKIINDNVPAPSQGDLSLLLDELIMN